MHPKVKASVTPAEAKTLLAKQKPEKQLQSEVVKALRDLGYDVIVTNAGIRKEAAAALRGSGMGAVFATPGTPDLYVRKLTYPQASWTAIELKTSTGTLSPAQKVIHDRGGSFVCRSLDDVLSILGEIPTTNQNKIHAIRSNNTRKNSARCA